MCEVGKRVRGTLCEGGYECIAQRSVVSCYSKYRHFYAYQTSGSKQPKMCDDTFAQQLLKMKTCFKIKEHVDFSNYV